MAWRVEVAKQFIGKGYSLTKILRVCDVPRSSWYSRLRRVAKGQTETPRGGRPIPGYTINPDGSTVYDQDVVEALRAYRSDEAFMNAGGHRKLVHYLRRDYGYHVNHKKLYRLCKEHDLLLPRAKKKLRKDKKICVNRLITGPNQLWEFDVKYGYLHGENRHFYLLAFVDVFTRAIRGFHVGLTCKAKDLKVTLERCLADTRGDLSALMIRSDNGPQMTSNMFKSYVDDIIEDKSKEFHEFIPPGCSNKNAHIESFFSIVETEFMQVQYFKSFRDAYIKTNWFIDKYNNDRLHGSLKYKTPREAEKLILEGKLNLKTIRV